MKFSIVFLAALAGQALAAPSSADAEDCGKLGVEDWDLSKLPEGTDPTLLRKCRLPPDHNPLEARSNMFEKRSCVKTPGRGCSNGRCWSDCGAVSGGHKWCWLAWTKGKGNWATCSTASDCKTSNAYTNMKCAIGNCKECGCSC